MYVFWNSSGKTAGCMYLNINVDCRMQTQPPCLPFAGGEGQEIRVKLNISQKPS